MTQTDGMQEDFQVNPLFFEDNVEDEAAQEDTDDLADSDSEDEEVEETQEEVEEVEEVEEEAEETGQKKNPLKTSKKTMKLWWRIVPKARMNLKNYNRFHLDFINK